MYGFSGKENDLKDLFFFDSIGLDSGETILDPKLGHTWQTLSWSTKGKNRHLGWCVWDLFLLSF